MNCKGIQNLVNLTKLSFIWNIVSFVDFELHKRDLYFFPLCIIHNNFKDQVILGWLDGVFANFFNQLRHPKFKMLAQFNSPLHEGLLHGHSRFDFVRIRKKWVQHAHPWRQHSDLQLVFVLLRMDTKYTEINWRQFMNCYLEVVYKFFKS